MPTPSPRDLILIDDLHEYAALCARVDAAVNAGALAVFLDLPEGEHTLMGNKIQVTTCGMGARHFVSRDSGHPCVHGFRSDDFKFWHDPAADCVTPILHRTFDAPGWTPILLSGKGGWGDAEWTPALAAAEKPVGNGMLRVCEVALAGRTETNPVAALFARRLLGLNTV
jgi:beta-mannosidase